MLLGKLTCMSNFKHILQCTCTCLLIMHSLFSHSSCSTKSDSCDPYSVSPSFLSPYTDKRVYFIICPSHQVFVYSLPYSYSASSAPPSRTHTHTHTHTYTCTNTCILKFMYMSILLSLFVVKKYGVCIISIPPK